MDNDALLTQDRETVADPRSESSFSSRAVAPAHTAVAAGIDRTGVFTHLVKDDSDITGLVAYSIYKQNKLDWLQAFETAKGRSPDEAELTAYIIGEGTPRRLATYRHLAESTLAGKGPDVEGVPRTGYKRPAASDNRLLTPAMLVTYVIIAALFVVAFWMAAHYTVNGR